MPNASCGQIASKSCNNRNGGLYVDLTFSYSRGSSIHGDSGDQIKSALQIVSFSNCRTDKESVSIASDGKVSGITKVASKIYFDVNIKQKVFNDYTTFYWDNNDGREIISQTSQGGTSWGRTTQEANLLIDGAWYYFYYYHYAASGQSPQTTITYKQNGNVCSKPTCGVWFYQTISVEIDLPKISIGYEIKNTNASVMAYAGKVFSTEFLKGFQIRRKIANVSGSSQYDFEVVKSQLELSRIPADKQIPYDTDSKVEFDYDISDLSSDQPTIHFTWNSLIHLKSGDAKFEQLQRYQFSEFGQTLKYNSVNIKEQGSLVYTDGTQISLNDIVYNSNPTFSSEIADNTYLDRQTTKNFFNNTYSMPTKHFGDLTFTYLNILGLAEGVKRIEIKGQPTVFKYGDVIKLFDDDKYKNAIFRFYDMNNRAKDYLIRDYWGYTTDRDALYGDLAQNHFQDGIKTLRLKLFGFEIFHKIVFQYTEDDIIVAREPSKKKYVINQAFKQNPQFDYSGMLLKCKRHNNELSDTEIKPAEEIDITLETQKTHGEIALYEARTYPIALKYTDPDGKVLNKQINLETQLLEVVEITVSDIGENESLTYYSNNRDKFKFPTGLVYTRRYNDNSTENCFASANNNISFYLTKESPNPLDSNSIIPAGTTCIYIKDSSGVFGTVPITMKEDNIISSSITHDEITIVLGNKLDQYKSSLNLCFEYESGNREENFTDFEFLKTDEIVCEEDISIRINGTVYILNKEHFIFSQPTIKSVSFVDNNLTSSYVNNMGIIDVREIKLKVEYNGATVEHIVSNYQKVGLTSENFNVYCSDMPNYVYDGSQTISLLMTSSVEKNLSLQFKVKSLFSEETKTISTNIQVLDIPVIEAISLEKVKDTYLVGEKFLNENDDTVISIQFTNKDGDIQRMALPLKNNFAGINIYPIKHTEFKIANKSQLVKVSSAVNSAIYVEYSIQIKNSYSEDTNYHQIRAIKAPNGFSYKVPNTGETLNLSEKYILVEDKDTKVVNGKRTIKEDNWGSIKLYGYLNNIFGKINSSVILFENYKIKDPLLDQVVVKFPCYNQENADKINHCTFGKLFGNNNAKNRLFLSGNKDYPNYDWHSGAVLNENNEEISGDFTYFEDTSYCAYGQTDNEVIGYDIVSNDKMVVLKSKSDKEPTIYYRSSGNTSEDGNTAEAFPLTVGNNGAGAISNKSILNFNGDTLFLSSDYSIDGLDISGIIGDTQRYANSRSKYINPLIKNHKVNFLWTNNKYLFVVFEDFICLTWYESFTSESKQYEWYKLDIADVQCIVEIDNTIYFGNSKGCFFKFENGIYKDTRKILLGTNESTLASEGEYDNKVLVSNAIMNELHDKYSYIFKIFDNPNNEEASMFYQVAELSNVKSEDTDIYIDTENNCLEVIGHNDNQRIKQIIETLTENKTFYLNHLESESEIIGEGEIKTYYKKYYCKEILDLVNGVVARYKIYDKETDAEIDLSKLYRAALCEKLNGFYKVIDIDKEENTFKLVDNNNYELNLVRYSVQPINNSFKAVMQEYKDVKAYYITAPNTMGNIVYSKTIWAWSLTNDTNIKSNLKLYNITKDADLDKLTELIKINTNSQNIFDLDNFSFEDLGFEKTILPYKYTFFKPLRVPFICFGLANESGENAVLSSLQVLYTVSSVSVGKN